MSYAIPDNRMGVNDNMSQWTQQFPELLPKNFIGIARIWDRQFPYVTNTILPVRNMEYNFQWQVYVNPATMAPFVSEGSDTPMSDAEQKFESFVCRETRLGAKISQRQIRFGIGNVVQTKVGQLVDAINLTRAYDNIQCLLGNNINQKDEFAVGRLQTAVAGKPHGSGTAKGWDEADNQIIADIIAMKTDVTKKCGRIPTDIYMPINELEYIHNDSEILDQLKYTSGDLLINGQITRIKGLKIHQVANFYKDRNKDGIDVKKWLLEDKVIVVAPNVGFTAVAEPRKGSAPEIERWWERKNRSIITHAYSSFCTVIEDYGKIGIISGTDSTVT